MIKVRPLRPDVPDEANFVAMNWRASFEVESLIARACGTKAYQRFMRFYVNALRAEGATYTLIVTPEQDDDHFLGFAVIAEPELHFVYVKPEFRGAGIARSMLEGRSVEAYTTETPLLHERIRPIDRAWQFRPRFTL